MLCPLSSFIVVVVGDVVVVDVFDDVVDVVLSVNSVAVAIVV